MLTFSENVHLQPYDSEDDFYARNYPKYLALLERASTFLLESKARPEKTLVFVRCVSDLNLLWLPILTLDSAGFDACEHEHQGMQRHDRRVPVGRQTLEVSLTP